MAHQFTVHATLQGISLDQFQQLLRQPQLHEAVCRRLPCDYLEITESTLQDQVYTLRRIYQPEVHLPEVAKKVLKDSLKIQRVDFTNFADANSRVELAANFPLRAQGQRQIRGDENSVQIEATWQVEVKIPLVGGLLEKHAETEIRRLTAVEVAIIQDEIEQRLAATEA